MGEMHLEPVLEASVLLIHDAVPPLLRMLQDGTVRDSNLPFVLSQSSAISNPATNLFVAVLNQLQEMLFHYWNGVAPSLYEGTYEFTIPSPLPAKRSEVDGALRSGNNSGEEEDQKIENSMDPNPNQELYGFAEMLESALKSSTTTTALMKILQRQGRWMMLPVASHPFTSSQWLLPLLWILSYPM